MKTSEKIVSVAAVVIAMSALIVSIWQGCENRKHNRMSVRPYLNIVTNHENDGNLFMLWVKNNGHGPAIIKDCRLKIGEKTFRRWSKCLASIEKEQFIRQSFHFTKDDLIGAGEIIKLITVDSFGYSQKGIRIEIDYESIYEEKSMESWDL